MNLEETLKEVWPKVRERHLYPELPFPKCAGGTERVGMDIKGKKICISEDFVAEMDGVIEPGEVMEGLLDHAVSHYLFCPWDFSTHLKLYRQAKKVLKDKHMAQKATDYFMDVVADTHCVSQKETPLPNLYRHIKKGPLDEAVHALCQRIWGVDLGVEGHEEISRKLSRLPYLDRGRWGESIRRFSKVLRSLLWQERSDGSSGTDRLDSHKLQQYSSQEIDRGLKELAVGVDAPADFKEIVGDFESDILEASQSADPGMGLGKGQSLDADILYYMKLAEHWLLPVKKTPMKKSGFLYPHHHIPWEAGAPYQDIDPWTSFGKIMPGITQTWQRLEGEAFGREEGTPDCIVIIDSSGSMTNPRKHLSHAVLGAACACDAYLRNSAQVAVYNFSDAYAGGRQVLPFTRGRKEIYRALCHYFGGGTQLLIKDIEDLQNERAPDIFLITDMQITNLEILIKYFNECKNRVTAVHIGQNKRARTFRRSMGLRKNIGIYAVEKKEDIPRIVLGKVREYLGAAGR